MRFFQLINLQDVFLYIFPTLAFMVIFGIFLGYVHFRNDESDRRLADIVHRYPGGIEERNAPFPLGMTLTIIGAVLWAFFYILLHGILEVKI